MKKEYFVGRNPISYIDFRERATLLFHEIFTHPTLCANAKEMTDLVISILSRIEIYALLHNEKVKELTQNAELSLDEMQVPVFRNNCICGCDYLISVSSPTNQYVLVGENGSIEIHQKIEGHSIFNHNEVVLYWENRYETLILKRSGTDFKDVWGDQLDQPIEKFTAFPESKHGRIVLSRPLEDPA